MTVAGAPGDCLAPGVIAGKRVGGFQPDANFFLLLPPLIV